MQVGNWTQTLWWLVHKDLLREYRGRRVWPGMVLLGIVLVLILEMQMDLAADQKQRVIGGLFWLAVFFAGTLALERSFSGEREEGCWQALRLYPLSPATIFTAKLAVNVLALSCLECVLIPAFLILSNMPILCRPEALLLVALLGNIGFAAVGTLLSALTSGLQHRGNLLVLLLLPMISPVVLGAAEATRLMMAGDLGPQWWLWVQLLAGFAVLFTTVGMLIFEFVIED